MEASNLQFVATPLTILDFSPLFRARGATNQLYELVSQSCWLRRSSLLSYFVVF
jgi:hypothetical protein